MSRDIRQSALFKEAEQLYRELRQPGTGQISDAAEISASPDGKHAVFIGTLLDKLEGALSTRICQIDLASGQTRVMTFGPNIDRLPKYSPDGQTIAFLSDRHRAGDFQLYLLDPVSGAARACPFVEGWVEYLHWSPDGSRILLGLAGYGADVAGGQGAVTSERHAEPLPPWMPAVETGDEGFRWRRAWIYEVASGRVRKIDCEGLNIWEAVWSGNDAIAGVVSDGPGEGLWYTARLASIDARTGQARDLYRTSTGRQLGLPAGSSDGRLVAVVEALCSDRGIVAGELLVVDTRTGSVTRPDCREVDFTYTEWCSGNELLLAGHRKSEAVIARYALERNQLSEVWSSHEITGAGRYITVSALPGAGHCVLVAEGFKRAPEIAAIREGRYQTIRSFDLGYYRHIEALASADPIEWRAPDGLTIHGWLLQPKGEGPFPLVMNLHGGPVWQWRPMWLGRWAATLMLVQRGFAVFLPNPRGSSGFGQSFIQHVVGDMGGADTFDYLSGLDHLVETGVADPERIGVTGVSYGGFMSAWLVTQDTRFAAAIPVAPVSNYVTEHLISNIPHFVSTFLEDEYTNPTGKYFTRSPVMHARNVKTPVLNICGALDRCTPPEEAVQFHNALLEHGATSVLVTYPEEGHGIRRFPAAIDYCARVVGWFEQHLNAPGYLP